MVSAYAGSLSGRVVVTRVGVHSWMSQNAWSGALREMRRRDCH